MSFSSLNNVKPMFNVSNLFEDTKEAFENGKINENSPKFVQLKNNGF